MTPQNVPRKRYSLFVLALVVLLAGGVALLVGQNYPAALPFGGLAAIASVYLFRKSNVRSGSGSGDTSFQVAGLNEPPRPGPLMWIVGMGLLVMLGISFLFLYLDALHGGHEVLPVYLFAGVVLVCGSYWAYLVSRLQ